MKEEKTPEVKHSEVAPALKKDTAKMVWMIVAIVAILALIGSIAYGYMSMKNLNKKISDQQSQINDLTNKKKLLEDAASAAAGGVANAVVNVRKIPELGVQYQINSTNQNASYAYQSNNNAGTLMSSAAFTTTSLADANAKVITSTQTNNCFASTGPLGYISKYNPGQIAPSHISGSEANVKIEDVKNVNVRKVGGAYFVLTSPQSTCSDSTAVNNLQSSQIPIVKDIFNSLVVSQ